MFVFLSDLQMKSYVLYRFTNLGEHNLYSHLLHCYAEIVDILFYFMKRKFINKLFISKISALTFVH